jgi:hypothetical protein
LTRTITELSDEKSTYGATWTLAYRSVLGKLALETIPIGMPLG